MYLHSSYLATNALLKLYIDAHIKMSMCTYADYTLEMNQATHSLPRHQIWAGSATASNTQYFIVFFIKWYVHISSDSHEDGDNKACCRYCNFI